jgi:hypothetical protein
MRRWFPRTGFRKPGQYREAVATVWQNLRERLRIRPRTKPATKPAAGPGARHRPGPPPGRHLEYSPQLDGHADPGEIVWTWVPYEEDHRHGKDRPVLVVGRDRRTLYGLMLSSNSERDGQRNWIPLGAGAWDGEHRPSWLRLDRVLEVDEDGIRREGAILDGRRFAQVAAVLKKSYGWH